MTAQTSRHSEDASLLFGYATSATLDNHGRTASLAYLFAGSSLRNFTSKGATQLSTFYIQFPENELEEVITFGLRDEKHPEQVTFQEKTAASKADPEKSEERSKKSVNGSRKGNNHRGRLQASAKSASTSKGRTKRRRA